ncbi:DUF1574 domain-containing protein [Sulfurimonas sp.]|nr:DUF1574 domain-containing protein [Sulfurimonas sp.]
MKHNQWNKTIIYSIIILLTSIISFNYIIDPYFVFNSSQINGLNTIKRNTVSAKMSKFHTAKRSDAKIMLFGTSRTEHINPLYLKKYTDNKIYNMALPGSGINSQAENIKYFVEKKGVTTVFLGVDFFSFNPFHTDDKTESQNIRYKDDYTKDYMDSLLSIRTFRKSIKTLKDNLKSKKHNIDYYTGWRNYNDDYSHIEKEGNIFIEKNVIKQIKLYSSKRYNYNYPPFKEPSSLEEPFRYLKQIQDICEKNNVKIYMFISPLYSRITDLIYSRGYDKSYHRWKKELSKYENIYDFSGYNSITTDISNYIDGSHYQTKLAKFMFAKIFDDKSVDVPSDFGIILSSKNIDKVLLEQSKRAKINNESRKN